MRADGLPPAHGFPLLLAPRSTPDIPRRLASPTLTLSDIMARRIILTALALAFVPAISSAQGSPVAQAFRDNAKDVGKNLMAAADLMPADKYAFKPTPAQMSFADIVVHLSQGNDFLCGALG